MLSQDCEKRLLSSSCLSVCMEQLGFHWEEFHEIVYFSTFGKSVEKIKISFKPDKNRECLREEQYTFMMTDRLILIRMRNV